MGSQCLAQPHFFRAQPFLIGGFQLADSERYITYPIEATVIFSSSVITALDSLHGALPPRVTAALSMPEIFGARFRQFSRTCSYILGADGAHMKMMPSDEPSTDSKPR